MTDGHDDTPHDGDDAPCRWTVADGDPRRLDAFLMQTLDLSRSRAIALLESGVVLVNGRYADRGDKGRVLSAGDAVELIENKQGEAVDRLSRVVPQGDLALPIVSQGEGWVIVNKPAGMPVHPLKPGETGTALNGVAAKFPAIAGVGEGGLRSGVVHRLDVEASGLLLFATTQAAWQSLRKAFQDHRTEKVYHAIVAGRLEGEGRCELDLFIARHRPALVRVLDPHTPAIKRPPASAIRACDMTWQSLRAGDRASLLEIHLGTGFLHQIRVTLAHLGHPVLGDRVYGDTSSADRLMLHACRLRAGPAEAAIGDPPGFTDALM